MPKIDHQYWVYFVYLKRFNLLPYAGGWADQPAIIIDYFNIVMSVESLIYGNERTARRG